MRDLLIQYTEYNVWANKRIAGLLKPIDKTLFDEEVKSSFTSLRKTVKHIYDAEMIWLKRLGGVSLTQWPDAGNMSGDKIFTFYGSSIEFSEFIASKDTTFLEGNCNFTNLKNETFTMPVSGIVMHIMNHSTFHRGQLITMFRSLGITDLPATDLIAYLRINKQA